MLLNEQARWRAADAVAQERALCVAVHDVAPATWPECLHLLHAVRAVADIPISWLVVPRYHGSDLRSRSCESLLGQLLGEGHELVLHGLTHIDPLAASGGWRDRWLRRIYTQGEGEFAAIDQAEAQRRLELGLAWFAARGWPVTGFVPPAWLISGAARDTLAGYPFSYTTSYTRFDLLPEARSLWSPALVYASRNRSGRIASPVAAGALAKLLQRAPLVRVALHPRDAHFPALVRHAQQLIEHLLITRDAMTKAAFACRMSAWPTSTAPIPHPGSSDAGQSPRDSSDIRSAAHPPSH